MIFLGNRFAFSAIKVRLLRDGSLNVQGVCMEKERNSHSVCSNLKKAYGTEQVASAIKRVVMVRTTALRLLTNQAIPWPQPCMAWASTVILIALKLHG
jgi:hypothetical protein